jgi:multidrug efflux pump subunit AcrB
MNGPDPLRPNPVGPHQQGHDLLARVTGFFLEARLVPALILLTLLLGAFAVLSTPSEEEPQIIVPMIDVQVHMPGASPKEVESRVVSPMERLLWEIPGVEYVYSTAMDGQAQTIVRFKVGEDPEKSLIKTYDKLYQHLDWIPPGCSTPILKPKSIDDVPVLVLTFWTGGHNAALLRQIASRANDGIKALPGVAQTTLTGGLRRQVTVRVRPGDLRQTGLDAADVLDALVRQNQARTAGEQTQDGRAVQVSLDNFLRSAQDVEQCVVGLAGDRPVFLRDVAEVTDGPAEPEDYVFFVPGPAAGRAGIPGEPGVNYPAVSLAVAKRPGVNANDLCQAALRKVEDLKGFAIPADVTVTATRNYGLTAKDKSSELLDHLLIATLTVGGLIALFLGLRASLVVMVAVPVTLALTLVTYYFMGYTLNRVTLFALIFCIGILVDDPIVDVENIVRHIHLPGSRGRPFREVIAGAVNEVRAPLVLATFTVIGAIMPMAFVGGLMGPYMRPMPVGASVAMLLSMAVAFVITPWTALTILKPDQAQAHETPDDAATRLYRRFMGHLIREPRWRWTFIGFVLLLLGGACLLFPARAVLVKMLPFDNKGEFQVLLDLPGDAPLERTAALAEDMARALSALPEVTDVQTFAGTAAPMTFNGLIRHYDQRGGPRSADISVNLTHKSRRTAKSHDLARQAREILKPLADRAGARLKVVEVPPGPPVLQTLVAEVYGPEDQGRLGVARQVKEVFASTPSVVDVDWYVDEPRQERRVVVERDKALQNGLDPERVLRVLSTGLSGGRAGLLHDPRAEEDVPIVVRYPLERRTSAEDLASLLVRGNTGRVVALGQAARVHNRTVPTALYHKNLQPVVYVTGDMAGAEESPVYGMARMDEALARIAARGQGAWGKDGPLPIHYTRQPFSTKDWSMKWDGEWQITYEVFRDMGLAFGAVMLLIYLLVVGWFGSYTTPIAIMSPIPLSLIGIIPAHALAGAFFTATSMIGFIAGAGIVVRNSIILVDFIEMRRSQGLPLAEAVIEAGAVRFRPMLLTALAVVAGSFVILFDPIFQGLAISLLAGEVAATVFSRMVVPVMYYLDQHRKERAEG